MTRTAAVLTALTAAVLLPATLLGPPAQAATLPGGRSTYVMTTFAGASNAHIVRLSMYMFATNGTVTERYWAWRQDGIAGVEQAKYTKVPSGYTTTGCVRSCPIRTPVGFQSGGTPKTTAGTWYMDRYGRLVIKWGALLETWRLDASQAGFVSASIWNSNRNIREGYGFGSNASPNVGVTRAAVTASARLYGPIVQNNYAVATTYSNVGFHFPSYNQCTGARCLQGKAVIAADRKTWFNTYVAVNPAADGRKNFWNFQTGAVQQAESPYSVCISNPGGAGGGHTAALLQVIDDSGRFRGYVGVEASLNRRAYGQAVVSSFVSVLPTMLPTLH